MKTNKNPESNEAYWFPTPENPGNVQEHTPIQRRILKELQELQEIEKLNPLDNPESRGKIPFKFRLDRLYVNPGRNKTNWKPTSWIPW